MLLEIFSNLEFILKITHINSNQNLINKNKKGYIIIENIII